MMESFGSAEQVVYLSGRAHQNLWRSMGGWPFPCVHMQESLVNLSKGEELLVKN